MFALVIHSNILSGGFLFFQLQRYCWLWVLINSTEATNYSLCDLSNDLLDSTQSIQLVTILLPIHHKVPTSLLIYHSIKDSIKIVWKIQPPKLDMKIHFFPDMKNGRYLAISKMALIKAESPVILDPDYQSFFCFMQIINSSTNTKNKPFPKQFALATIAWVLPFSMLLYT